MSKPVVLVYGPIHSEGTKVLEGKADIRLSDKTDTASIVAAARDVDGIVMRAFGQFGVEVMDAAPKLKVIGRHGVGVDNVDVEAATARGIWVVNTPDAVTQSVAEHVIALMLGLIRRLAESDRAMRSGHWSFRNELRGFELPGKTLGVVGMGRIGFRTARICRLGFDMEILYSDVHPSTRAEEQLGARKVELAELLVSSDVVTLHTPYLPETHHLINEETLRLMKPSAILINVARGKVVDQAALYCALSQGRIAGAGLDVFEEEPTTSDNPLFTLQNVLLTPHAATSTTESLIGMSLVTKDVLAVLQGREPANPVNRPQSPRH